MTQPTQQTARGFKSRIALVVEKAKRSLALEGKAHSFWLLCAAIFLPFGWVFLVLQAEPVRTFVKSVRRNLL